MSYYPDLSKFSYENCLIDGVLNVGWLDRQNPFPKKEPSKNFLDALWLHCHYFVYVHRGFHTCNLCAINTDSPLNATYNNESIELGFSLIPVLHLKDVFISPSLIFHYVIDHHYSPPENFINAVLAGRPGTIDYENQLNLHFLNTWSVCPTSLS